MKLGMQFSPINEEEVLNLYQTGRLMRMTANQNVYRRSHPGRFC